MRATILTLSAMLMLTPATARADMVAGLTMPSECEFPLDLYNGECSYSDFRVKPDQPFYTPSDDDDDDLFGFRRFPLTPVFPQQGGGGKPSQGGGQSGGHSGGHKPGTNYSGSFGRSFSGPLGSGHVQGNKGGFSGSFSGSQSQFTLQGQGTVGGRGTFNGSFSGHAFSGSLGGVKGFGSSGGFSFK